MRNKKGSSADQTSRVFGVLREAVMNNGGVYPGLWIGAFLSLAAASMKDCTFSYEQYCEEMDNSKKMMKRLWEEDEVD